MNPDKAADEFADLYTDQDHRQNGPDPRPAGKPPDWTPGFQHLVLAVCVGAPHLVKFSMQARELAGLFGGPHGAPLPLARVARWLGAHYEKCSPKGEKCSPKGPPDPAELDQVIAEGCRSLQGVEREEAEAEWAEVRAISLPEDMTFVLERVHEAVGRQQLSNALLDAAWGLSTGEPLADVTLGLDHALTTIRMVDASPWAKARLLTEVLADKHPARRWIEAPLAERGALTFLFAPRAVGKSVFLMAKVMAWDAAGYRVLYLDRDNSPGSSTCGSGVGGPEGPDPQAPGAP